MQSEKKRLEQRLLMQSVGLMSLVAFSGTFMGVYTNSNAILLDGICSFIAVIIKLMMLITSKLISRETSKRFQFGYWHFEPLVLFVEGCFTLLIIVYAFFSGINDLIGNGRMVKLGPAILYSIFFTIVDVLYYFYVHSINKSLKSNLVRFDNISWSIDAMLEAGILISFIGAFTLSSLGYDGLVIYVDPLVLILLSLQMLPSSLKIIIPSIKQIMGVAPVALHNKVQFIMDNFLKKYKFIDYVSSVQVYGNVRIIEIDILVPPNYGYQNITELDVIRDEIDQAIGGNSDEKWLTITFTANRKWMAKDYSLDT